MGHFTRVKQKVLCILLLAGLRPSVTETRFLVNNNKNPQKRLTSFLNLSEHAGDRHTQSEEADAALQQRQRGRDAGVLGAGERRGRAKQAHVQTSTAARQSPRLPPIWVLPSGEEPPGLRVGHIFMFSTPKPNSWRVDSRLLMRTVRQMSVQSSVAVPSTALVALQHNSKAVTPNTKRISVQGSS